MSLHAAIKFNSMKYSILFHCTIAVFCLFVSTTTLAKEVSAEKGWGPRDFSGVDNKWTAIVAAFAPEITAINMAFSQTENAQIDQTLVYRGVTYQLGHYKGEPVIIFTTGISVANAAMTMQMALDYFPIDKVVMMGIAGAINESFSVGDIAVPERWYFHDESVYANPENQGYNLPEFYELDLHQLEEKRRKDSHIPAYSNLGYLHPRDTSVVKDGFTKPQSMQYFSVSSDLLNLAQQALDKRPNITMPSGKPINIQIGGNGVTGSVFVDNAEYRLWLRNVFAAEVAEMESAAVGQVCYVNNVDWLVIRSVSDLAGGQKGKNEESVFEAIASGTGTQFLFGILDEIVGAE